METEQKLLDLEAAVKQLRHDKQAMQSRAGALETQLQQQAPLAALQPAAVAQHHRVAPQPAALQPAPQPAMQQPHCAASFIAFAAVRDLSCYMDAACRAGAVRAMACCVA